MRRYKCFLFLFLFCLSITSVSYAQTNVNLTKGYIEYEKTVNKYAITKLLVSNKASAESDLENYKKSNTQFQTSTFKLYFDDQKSLYFPENVSESREIVDQVTANNIVYSDFLNNQIVSQKKVFNDLFLIKDSAKKIRWKITNETREIAGYECRRANAVIEDSVYVVAFYTIDIIPTGGPELFNGLPGMILGVSLPHEHITWFAKTVVGKTNLDFPKIAPPTKGKESNLLSLKSGIKNDLKQFGIPTLDLITKYLTF